MDLGSKQDSGLKCRKTSKMKGTLITNNDRREGRSLILDIANQHNLSSMCHSAFISFAYRSAGGWLIKHLLRMSPFLFGPAG